MDLSCSFQYLPRGKKKCLTTDLGDKDHNLIVLQKPLCLFEPLCKIVAPEATTFPRVPRMYELYVFDFFPILIPCSGLLNEYELMKNTTY